MTCEKEERSLNSGHLRSGDGDEVGGFLVRTAVLHTMLAVALIIPAEVLLQPQNGSHPRSWSSRPLPQ